MIEEGIIIIEDKEGTTLAVEHWTGTEQRQRHWNGWVDVACRYDNDGQHPLVLKEFVLQKEDSIQNLTDKQVGLLFRLKTPVRQITSTEIRFAERNEQQPYDYEATKRFVNDNRSRFDKFGRFTQSTLELLNRTLELKPDEKCRVERLFQLKGGFNFTADNPLKTESDVAWVFRNLSNKAVENSFALLSKGEQHIILHLGMGNNRCTMVDKESILYADSKFRPDKVWFIHNHPSGYVKASNQDMAIWKDLQLALGDKLQKGIIINTDTGIYGTFDAVNFDVERNNAVCNGRVSGSDDLEIPVFRFDEKLLHDKNAWSEMQEMCTAEQIAAYVSSQRFGSRERFGFLALDMKNRVMGNFFLPMELCSDRDEVARYISNVCIKIGAPVVAVYGTAAEGESVHQYVPANLSKRISRVSANTVSMIDFIEMKDGRMLRSHYDDNLLFEPDRKELAEQRKRFAKVEVIPAGEKRMLLRVQVGDSWLPAKVLQGGELKKFNEGLLEKEELAIRYLNEMEGEEQEAKISLGR